MGSYKWAYKWGNYSYQPYWGLLALLITTHEPPSSTELETLNPKP